MANGYRAIASMAKKVLGALNVVLATKHGALRTLSKNTRRDVRDAKQRCCHAAYGRTTRSKDASKTRQRMINLMINFDVAHVVHLVADAITWTQMKLTTDSKLRRKS